MDGLQRGINKLGGDSRFRETAKMAPGIKENGTVLREQKQQRGCSKILQVGQFPGG
jgi:hypothetical protein